MNYTWHKMKNICMLWQWQAFRLKQIYKIVALPHNDNYVRTWAFCSLPAVHAVAPQPTSWLCMVCLSVLKWFLSSSHSLKFVSRTSPKDLKISLFSKTLKPMPNQGNVKWKQLGANGVTNASIAAVSSIQAPHVQSMGSLTREVSAKLHKLESGTTPISNSFTEMAMS